MAEYADPTQYDALSQLGAMLGIGDNGTSGAMTVPTALNTSNNWSPPSVGGAVGQGATSGLGAGFGANIGTGQLALTGLTALASLFGASQQNSLAKKQFSFQKNLANTNLNNQIQSYNTSLEDRLNSRGVAEGRTSEYTAEQLARNRLTR